jgi:hypothetical protein
MLWQWLLGAIDALLIVVTFMKIGFALVKREANK